MEVKSYETEDSFPVTNGDDGGLMGGLSSTIEVKKEKQGIMDEILTVEG